MIVAGDSRQVWDLLALIERELDDPQEYMVLNGLECKVVCWCKDCGYDLLPLYGKSERYMVHDELWAATGLEPEGGELCIGCIERRIGRRLVSEDFTEYPINRLRGKTERLCDRLMVPFV